MQRIPSRLLAVCTLVLVASACTRVTEVQPMTGAQPAPIFMPPGQIAGIVMVANNGEVAMGDLALEKSTNERVREFAEHLRMDHADANEALNALLAEENWTSSSSEASMELEEEGDDHLEMLRDMEGDAFDLHFMQTQVQAHQNLLERLDQILIRAAEDDDMEAYLRNLRAGVAQHLATAEDIVDDLEA